jgi:hypothetical protein
MNSIAADPVPFWNDGPAKQAILAFILVRKPARQK